MNNTDSNNPFAAIQRSIQQQTDQAMKINQMIVNEKAEAREREQTWKDEMLAETKQTRVTLEHTNELLQQKLADINVTLDFILNSMGGNFQRLEKTQLLVDKRIQEVAEIVAAKDGSKLKTYIEEHGLEAIGTILSFVSLLSH